MTPTTGAGQADLVDSRAEGTADGPVDPGSGTVEIAPGIRLWIQDLACTGTEPRDPLLLIMGADRPGLAWPDPLVTRLTTVHRVIRYDHRDTGRSTAVFDDRPYGPPALAADAIAVLDALGIGRAHVVGMGLGGLLVQLLMLDRPDRLVSATALCTGPLGRPGGPVLPGPGTALRRLRAEIDDERDRAGELAWRVAHLRLLNGAGTPFDADAARAREERLISHTGHHEPPTAHAHLLADGLDRGAELAGCPVPLLVVEAPQDPVYPPPNSEQLARSVPRGELVRIEGMGHALNDTVIPALAAAILAGTQPVQR